MLARARRDARRELDFRTVAISPPANVGATLHAARSLVRTQAVVLRHRCEPGPQSRRRCRLSLPASFVSAPDGPCPRRRRARSMFGRDRAPDWVHAATDGGTESRDAVIGETRTQGFGAGRRVQLRRSAERAIATPVRPDDIAA